MYIIHNCQELCSLVSDKHMTICPVVSLRQDSHRNGFSLGKYLDNIGIRKLCAACKLFSLSYIVESLVVFISLYQSHMRQL